MPDAIPFTRGVPAADLIPVDDVTVRIDGEHPVAVAVERDTEVEAVRRDG